MSVVPMTVDGDSRHRRLDRRRDQRAGLVGADLVLGWQPRGSHVDAGRSVMGDEDVERPGAEARDVGVVRRLARPPVDPVSAVAPVDRECTAEEPGRQTPESDPRCTRNVGHVIGQGDWGLDLAMLCKCEVVVVVAVDEPELDAISRARGIDGRQESRPVGKIWEVAEVADLDDHRAALLSRGVDESLDPCCVAVGVTGHQHATDIGS